MRIGIIGAGFMGTTHAESWAKTPAHLSGVMSLNSQNAQTLATRYGARHYTTIEALLDNVDVVDICTPTPFHEAMVLQAVAAGKHIICEKPLARTIPQAQRMIAACRQAKVKLLVAHVVRFFPEYRQAQALVASGEIGPPAVIRLSRTTFHPKIDWFADETQSGGLMLDLMIHDFDYARWVAGDVRRVFAKTIHSRYPDQNIDHALVILTHQDGAISHIEGSWAYPPPIFRTRFEIATADGWLEHDSQQTAAIQSHLHQSNTPIPDVPLPSSPLHESPYTTQLTAFYEHLQHDTPLPVTAVDGLAALQIALAAIESARTAQPIELTPLPEVSS